MTIVLLRRFSVAEHHARCHGICALCVGVVEALDVTRQLRQAEIFLNLHQQARRALLGIKFLHGVDSVDFSSTGVVVRHVEQLTFVAALWHSEQHADVLEIGDERHDNFAQIQAEFFACTRYGITEHFGGRFVEASAQFVGFATHHRAAAHVHIVDKGAAVIGLERENVDVADLRTDDDRLRAISLNQVVFHLHLLRLLEAQISGKTLHFSDEIVFDWLGVAGKNLANLVDIYGIFIGANCPGAASSTVVNVIFQAHLMFST